MCAKTLLLTTIPMDTDMDTGSFRFNVNMGTASPAHSQCSSHLNIDYAFFTYFSSITAPVSGKKTVAGVQVVTASQVPRLWVSKLVY